jgi:hypothetical protein
MSFPMQRAGTRYGFGFICSIIRRAIGSGPGSRSTSSQVASIGSSSSAWAPLPGEGAEICQSAPLRCHLGDFPDAGLMHLNLDHRLGAVLGVLAHNGEFPGRTACRDLLEEHILIAIIGRDQAVSLVGHPSRDLSACHRLLVNRRGRMAVPAHCPAFGSYAPLAEMCRRLSEVLPGEGGPQTTEPALCLHPAERRTDRSRGSSRFIGRAEVAMTKCAMQLPIRHRKEPLGLAVSVVPKRPAARRSGSAKATEIGELSARIAARTGSGSYSVPLSVVSRA